MAYEIEAFETDDKRFFKTKARVFRSDENEALFGVEVDRAVQYEADLPLETARRIVQLINTGDDPETWEGLQAILDAEGYKY
jgi:hypothetical protein